MASQEARHNAPLSGRLRLGPASALQASKTGYFLRSTRPPEKPGGAWFAPEARPSSTPATPTPAGCLVCSPWGVLQGGGSPPGQVATLPPTRFLSSLDTLQMISAEARDHAKQPNTKSVRLKWRTPGVCFDALLAREGGRRSLREELRSRGLPVAPKTNFIPKRRLCSAGEKPSWPKTRHQKEAARPPQSTVRPKRRRQPPSGGATLRYAPSGDGPQAGRSIDDAARPLASADLKPERTPT